LIVAGERYRMAHRTMIPPNNIFSAPSKRQNIRNDVFGKAATPPRRKTLGRLTATQPLIDGDPLIVKNALKAEA
jgi:hypothetical protein